jgi:excisionase family DNA binding protein
MSIMATIPGYLTVSEAADVIGVSHAQVTRYITEGLLKSSKIGRQYLIHEADAKNFQRPPRGNPLFRKENRGTKKRR